MFHLDQQPTDSNPWQDQSSNGKQVGNSNGSVALDTHLTPLTDVPDEEEEEDDNATSPSSKSNDDKKQKPSESDDPIALERDREENKEKDVAKKTKDPSPTADVEPVVVNGTKSPERRTIPALPASSPSGSNKLTKGPSSTAPSTPARTASPSKSDIQRTDANGLDPRVSVLLDINAELLRIFIEFQSRNLHHSADCQAYVARLQSNLNWLAASMDKNTGPVPILPLPNFDAPPMVDFVNLEKVGNLYAQLPHLFARDVIRQQRLKLKRERAPEDDGSNVAKRQDLGDNKVSSLLTAQAQNQSPPNVPNGVTHHSSPPPNQAQSNFAARQPSMERPQVPNIVTPSPDLQRANQMNHQHATPPLPSGSGAPFTHQGSNQTPTATDTPQRPSPNPTHPYAQDPSSPALSAQVAQILQEPSNQPFVKFLLTRDPQFNSRPPNVQLHHLQIIQQQLRRQQQARMSGQPGTMHSPIAPTGQMHAGFPPSINSQGSNFPAQMPPGNGPNPAFPNGIVPNSMQPPPSTSRPGSSHLLAQQLAGQNLQSLNPQQRQQLMLMQQQRMGGIGTPQRPNTQGFPYQQHSPQHGSPTGFPDNSGDQQQMSPAGHQLPGSSVPGIAKSNRSPSVPIPSPIKSQGSFGPESYQQAMSMSASQQLALQHSQMSQMALQQGQINHQVPNQGWPPTNVGMGMNPNAFQMNTAVGNPGQQQAGGVQMFVNPNSLGMGSGQQPPGTGQGWPPQQQLQNSGSPIPNPNDPSASQRTSATPGPGMAQIPPHFENNPYPQWS